MHARRGAVIATGLGFVAIAQCIVYLLHPQNPFLASNSVGWNGWWDQSQYLRSSLAFAHGDLSPEEHWYFPGYSLLAAPFAFIAPKDPFFPINLAAVLLFSSAFVAYFRSIIGSMAAFVVLIAALLLPPVITEPDWRLFPIWSQFAIPWNTTPVAAAIMLCLLLVRDLGADLSGRRDVYIGLLAGLVLVTRPIDMVALVPLGLIYFWQRIVVNRSWRCVLAAAIGAAVIALPVCLLLLQIHGQLVTPYTQQSANIGFGLSNLPLRAITIFLDGSTTFGESTSVFNLQPWLYLAAPLALAWLATDARRAFAPLSTITAAYIAYLAYNDLSPWNLVRYNLVHYFVWTLPILSAAGLAGAYGLWRRRAWLPAALLGVALPIGLLGYRLVPVELPVQSVQISQAENGDRNYVITLRKSRRVDAVDFVGASTEDRGRLSIVDRNVVIDGRRLHVLSGFNVLAAHNAIRIMAKHKEVGRVIEVTLDGLIDNQPTAVSDVRPVVFSSAWRFPLP